MNAVDQGPSSGPTLLLVDDDRVLRERLARAFRERGFEVATAADAREALTGVGRDSPELAVVDLRMPGDSGLQLLRALLEHDPHTRVVMLTGYGSITTAIEAMRLGAVNYLPKPADADEILAAFAGVVADGPAHSAADQGTDAVTPSLERAKWEHINRVLADVGGNVTECARRLGVHRRSLQRMLAKHPPRR